jgi:uncharacterized protein
MADFDRPSNQEDEYFAREDIEKKRRIALHQASELAAKQKEDLKKLHYMKCPKCGMDLQKLDQGSVEIDTCFNCKGIWLDAGELEALTSQGKQKAPVIDAVLNIFRRN